MIIYIYYVVDVSLFFSFIVQYYPFVAVMYNMCKYVIEVLPDCNIFYVFFCSNGSLSQDYVEARVSGHCYEGYAG